MNELIRCGDVEDPLMHAGEQTAQLVQALYPSGFVAVLHLLVRGIQ
jgi:hypothetical protein